MASAAASDGDSEQLQLVLTVFWRADNEVNGVPSCASRELLTELTRSAWNFTGVWVSDCGAVQDVFANHKFAKSPVEAVRDVMDAGLDLNCGEHTL